MVECRASRAKIRSIREVLDISVLVLVQGPNLESQDPLGNFIAARYGNQDCLELLNLGERDHLNPDG